MIDVKITLDTATPGIRKFILGLQQTEVVHRQIGIQLYGWTIRNFDAAGAMQAPVWAPLSESTRKEKQRKGYSLQPLLRTGNLKNSFTPFGDKTSGGVGARASYFQGGKQFDYATAHQFGTEHIPARPMLPPDDYVRSVAISAYANFLKQAGQGSQVA